MFRRLVREVGAWARNSINMKPKEKGAENKEMDISFFRSFHSRHM